jgi:hypothetical protein
MGGFTTIKLRNCSESNIEKQNQALKLYGVSRKYRFYSEAEIRLEYEYFKRNDGNYPPHLFPIDRYTATYAEFKKYWSPKALGEVFCPHNGSLNFDCYFGRTSKRAMHNLAAYLFCNMSEIKSVDGSFSTFVERCGYGKKAQAELLELDK